MKRVRDESRSEKKKTKTKDDGVKKHKTASPLLEVWTDGSCPGNGTEKACAGLGVFFGTNDPRNLSERLPGRQTNQRAELMAAIRAVEQLNAQKPLLGADDEVKIYSDSQYVVSGITSWIIKWRAVGWRAKVLNKDIWQRLDKLVLAVPYKLAWQHVSAHSGIPGNEAADRLAKAGTILPMPEERVTSIVLKTGKTD